MKKILVSVWLDGGIQMLIPKQRGNGFLKVPVGHHKDIWMNDIRYDVDGLDGYLNVDCGVNSWETDKRDAVLEEIMPVICKRFCFPWEIIERGEFARLAR